MMGYYVYEFIEYYIIMVGSISLTHNNKIHWLNEVTLSDASVCGITNWSLPSAVDHEKNFG